MGCALDDFQLNAGSANVIFLNLLSFVRSEQSVIDEYTGQLITDSLVYQCGCDRRIHATAQATDHLFVANCGADRPNLLIYDR